MEYTKKYKNLIAKLFKKAGMTEEARKLIRAKGDRKGRKYTL